MAIMISRGKEFYTENQPLTEKRPQFGKDGKYWPFANILQQDEPKRKSGQSALRLAAITNTEGSLATLEELLRVDGIVHLDNENLDGTFEFAIENGYFGVVDKFFDRPELASVLVTDAYILRALKKLINNSKKNEQAQPEWKIVKRLVEEAKCKKAFNRTVVEEIIKAGLIEIWNCKPEGVPAEDLKSLLLHLAVKYQKIEFVELFLEKYPDSVNLKKAIEGGEQRYPLWYNNNHPAPGKNSGLKGPKDAREKIRTAIVSKMIHEVTEIETLTDIFYSSNEPVREICFDISMVNSTSYQLSEFVNSLIDKRNSQGLLSYEKTLRYAEFPSLDLRVGERETFVESSHLKHRHNEVFKILEWLKAKDVGTIIKLKVPDRLINPHDDIRMAEEVDRFNVEVLDWKVLDLSISVFKPKTRERIKELYLYSSGNRAVISHWFSNEGILSLKNLRILRIKIIQETCTSERCRALISEIQNQAQKLKSSSNSMKNQLSIESAKSLPWYPTPRLADLSEIAHRIAPKLTPWLRTLGSDISLVRNTVSNYKPTKVAILDNGILSISPVSHHDAEYAASQDKERMPGIYNIGGKTNKLGGDNLDSLPKDANKSDQSDDRSLWKHIVEGRSFVDVESKLSPWPFASNPHGTQMANLICAMDPFCELYVARVAKDTMGITSRGVAQAIAWAILKKVDIISMSFIVREDHNSEMLKKIDEASSAGILMTCSAHDEGSKVEEAWPASYRASGRSLLTLAACEEYGTILRSSTKDKIDYLINGKDIAAGAIPFLTSTDTITGISVSTAIAAGLSSLILTCDRVGKYEKEYAKGMNEGSRYKLVTENLNKMVSTDKFLPLEKFPFLSTRYSNPFG